MGLYSRYNHAGIMCCLIVCVARTWYGNYVTYPVPVDRLRPRQHHHPHTSRNWFLGPDTSSPSYLIYLACQARDVVTLCNDQVYQRLPLEMAPARDRKVSRDNQTLRTHSHISGKNYIGRELGEDEKQYYEPSHIWYAATVSPLCSASFGPLGLAFGISALIEPWRVTVPSSGLESDELFIADPNW